MASSWSWEREPWWMREGGKEARRGSLEGGRGMAARLELSQM
jgi:hypothetical protein